MESVVEAFLEHYGVRGMKWGQRKRSGGGSSTRSPTSISDGPETPKISTSSGSSRSKKDSKRILSEDQLVFNNLKARAKKDGIHSLSNNEIKVLTARADALSKARTTFPKKKTKKAALATFVIDDLLMKNGKSLLSEVVKEGMRTGAVKKGILPPKGKKGD